jgi:hypothetical protein
MHFDFFNNIDFQQHSTAAFHVSTIRVFLYQNEKSKKIFGSPKKDINNFDFGTIRNRVSVLAGQEINTFNNSNNMKGNLSQIKIMLDYFYDPMNSQQSRGIFEDNDPNSRKKAKDISGGDLLLAELRNDIIFKLAIKPTANGSK